MTLEVHVKRTAVFLASTFILTWSSWWLLAFLVSRETVSLQNLSGMSLYILGGSAPTIMAFAAVLLTPQSGSVQELVSRIFRIRIPFLYYLAAVLIPVLLGSAGRFGAGIIFPDYAPASEIQPLYLFIPLFASSIIFGGIEEVGWRGVLQPVLTKRLSLISANFIIGIIWALWHLPLFYVIGLSHYGNSFLLFTLAGIGWSAFMTWLYSRTGSIFICILFHASINAAASIGLAVLMSEHGAITFQSVLIFLTGMAVLFVSSRKAAVRTE